MVVGNLACNMVRVDDNDKDTGPLVFVCEEEIDGELTSTSQSQDLLS